MFWHAEEAKSSLRLSYHMGMAAFVLLVLGEIVCWMHFSDFVQQQPVNGSCLIDLLGSCAAVSMGVKNQMTRGSHMYDWDLQEYCACTRQRYGRTRQNHMMQKHKTCPANTIFPDDCSRHTNCSQTVHAKNSRTRSQMYWVVQVCRHINLSLSQDDTLHNVAVEQSRLQGLIVAGNAGARAVKRWR